MDIREKIIQLKNQRNALILAHFYQDLDIQLIADAVGDSFELAKRAKAAKEDVIVFCGVKFMAESAKILSPDKTVLLPRKDASCAMADMIDENGLCALKQKHPNAAVVCYINSTAKTKAYTDICCTSSNAQRVVNSIKSDEIIFVPDKNLGSYIAKQFPNKKFIFHEGFCPIHHGVSIEDIKAAKAAHPNALVLIHPECTKEALEFADFVGSTSQIISFAEKSDNKEFIIVTEKGVSDRLTYFNPDKKFYLIKANFICEDMKKTTLEDILNVLENDEKGIILSKELIDNAKKPLDRMMEI